jgi:hypothetical protein
MKHLFLALALQEEIPADNSSMWLILVVVLVALFFIVVIIGVALTIFFIARKRSKAKASAPSVSVSSGPGSYDPLPQSNAALPASEAATDYSSSPAPSMDAELPPVEEPVSDMRREETVDFDPTRTVAIIREPVAEDYGSIRFVSGVLAGQEFEVTADGAFIGREGSLSQIVVADPRISKRHLWIGVRDGAVVIVDQDSRNGTFVNDPRSERVTEKTLNSGDTVIMGESDVARFEYQA